MQKSTEIIPASYAAMMPASTPVPAGAVSSSSLLSQSDNPCTQNFDEVLSYLEHLMVEKAKNEQQIVAAQSQPL